MSDCAKILKEMSDKFELETKVEAHLSVVIEAALDKTESLACDWTSCCALRKKDKMSRPGPNSATRSSMEISGNGQIFSKINKTYIVSSPATQVNKYFSGQKSCRLNYRKL